jgi:hypothetical protein
MEARTHAAVSPFIGVVANDALDAKVWYQLNVSASTPCQGDRIVRCARLVASAQFVGSAHRMDGRAAIGTEPRVWEKSGRIPRFWHTYAWNTSELGTRAHGITITVDGTRAWA